MTSTQFAIIETGGKQYVVRKDDELSVEKLPVPRGSEYKEGDRVIFDKVLLVDDGSSTTVGTPYIKGAAVEASFLGAGRTRKVLVLHYKAKSNRRKKNTHRQHFNRIRIDAIL